MGLEGMDMRFSEKPVVERIRGQWEPLYRVRLRCLVRWAFLAGKARLSCYELVSNQIIFCERARDGTFRR